MMNIAHLAVIMGDSTSETGVSHARDPLGTMQGPTDQEPTLFLRRYRQFALWALLGTFAWVYAFGHNRKRCFESRPKTEVKLNAVKHSIWTLARFDKPAESDLTHMHAPVLF